MSASMDAELLRAQVATGLAFMAAQGKKVLEIEPASQSEEALEEVGRYCIELTALLRNIEARYGMLAPEPVPSRRMQTVALS